jgi:uncharacterized protein YbjQ (UPF0145 family)
MEFDTRPKTNYFLSVGGKEQIKIDISFITTALELPGYKIVRSCGIARGITCRSRNCCAAICAALCSLGGGRNSMFTYLCEQAREEALQLLIKQAQHMGGNAIIGFRYESHDIIDGITEVLAYGTAVEIVSII